MTTPQTTPDRICRRKVGLLVYLGIPGFSHVALLCPPYTRRSHLSVFQLGPVRPQRVVVSSPSRRLQGGLSLIHHDTTRKAPPRAPLLALCRSSSSDRRRLLQSGGDLSVPVKNLLRALPTSGSGDEALGEASPLMVKQGPGRCEPALGLFSRLGCRVQQQLTVIAAINSSYQQSNNAGYKQATQPQEK